MSSDADIALVEDDPEIRSLVAGYLEDNGLRVRACADGAALDQTIAAAGVPDLIVLDIMLPGEDGLSICRRVRGSVPILMLTAKADEIDRIVGLEIGADDYLVKPFNPRELLARIRAILRRGAPQSAPTARRTRLLQVGPLRINPDRRDVWQLAGEAIELTSAEFDLLMCFVDRPGRVLSRDQLMDWTRGRAIDTFDRTIDVQVSRLRKKIELGGTSLVKTIRNQGYMLAVDVVEV